MPLEEKVVRPGEGVEEKTKHSGETLEGKAAGLEGGMEGRSARAGEGKAGESREAVENMQLSELWEQSSREERSILLHRIPQAVRTAAALWKETGRGNGGSRQEEILRTIVERLETAQSLEASQSLGTAQNPGAPRGLGAAQNPGAQGLGAAQKLEAMQGLEGLRETGSAFSPQGNPEEIGHIFSGLPVGVFQMAAGELYGEDLVYRTDSPDSAAMEEKTMQPREGAEGKVVRLGENAIVYAVKTPNVPGLRKKNDDGQTIQEHESRISRQEYVIRQEQIGREELERRIKKQESRENALWKSGNMGLHPKQGGNLPQDVLDQLKERLHLERLRYGAD